MNEWSKEDDTVLACITLQKPESERDVEFEAVDDDWNLVSMEDAVKVEFVPTDTDNILMYSMTNIPCKLQEYHTGYARARKRDGRPDRSQGRPPDRLDYTREEILEHRARMTREKLEKERELEK
jgi:hypothetical protein